MTCRSHSVRPWYRRIGHLFESARSYCECSRRTKNRNARLALQALEVREMPDASPTGFMVAAGAAPGSQPWVKLYDGNTGHMVREFLAYDPAFRGGVNVALADLNGDGIPDVITGPGNGGGPHIRAFDGQTGSVIANFLAYDSAFRGGASVAAGNLDGHIRIVTGAGYGGGPHVKVFDTTGSEQEGFMAYDPVFRGGVSVAIGNVEGDGHGAIVTAAGKDGGPHIKVFDPNGRAVLAEWMAYDMAFRGGVNIAVGDLDGDGHADIVTGAGVGGGPHVRAFTYSGAPMHSFMAGSEDLRGGVTVGAARMCGCPAGPDDILTVVGDAGPAMIRSFDGGTCEPITRTGAILEGIGNGGGTVSAMTGPGPDVPMCEVNVVYPYGDVSEPNRITCDGPRRVPSDCQTGKDLVKDTGPSGQSAPGFSPGGVRYTDGLVSLPATDLSSGGPIGPWGSERTWSNGSEYDRGSFNGSGWVDSQLPSLLQVSGSTDLIEVGNATTAREFKLVSGTFVANDFLQDTLTQDTTNHLYILTDPNGNQIRFWDFSSGIALKQRGQFQSFTDPGGQVVQVTSQTGDKVGEIQSSSTVGSTTITESYLYSYVSSGANAGMIASVTLRRKVNSGSWSTVRSVEYNYYNGTESYGSALDLKTAVVKDGSGNTIDTSYYRYYTSSGSGGYTHGLKLAFGPASYERLKAVYSDPTTATDAQAAVYADHFLEFDGNHRVTLHTVQGQGCSTCTGGLGTYTYSYDTNSTMSTGYNVWKYKTVETLPDGQQNVVYSNAAGEVMLNVFQEMSGGMATGNDWATYYQYDSAGRVILTAMPSAVNGYSQSYDDLVHFVSGNAAYLNDSTGLISTNTYASSTTATDTSAGNVAGYLQSTAIQRGETGTAVPQSASQYKVRTIHAMAVDEATIYPVVSSTVYRNTNGTGGETTTYDYTWFSSTLRPEQVTTTLPTVTTGQNGPNSADVSYVVYDSIGRMIWTQDADGFLNYTAYDQATGAVTRTITDVDTTQTSDFTALPSGWSTPSGGGLHLKTDMLVDGLGRTTKVTAPNSTVRYTVYKDSDHEVRYYNWDVSGSQPIGPVTMMREDRAHKYSETLTFTSTSTWPSAPDGTEAISTVQSLSRSIVNDAGQTVDNDQYFTLSGTSYSQSSATLGSAWDYTSPSGGNYYRTELSYDDYGRLKRVLAPTGTITRTVYDTKGRLSSTWVGTDDTPTSGYWSPTNLTGTDTVKVSENEYDAGGIGDSNLTTSTQFPNGSTDPRVTAYSYDWRDRRIATKSGVEGSESTSLNRPIFYVELDNLGEVLAREQYDGDTVSITTDGNSDGVPDRPSSSLLRAKSTAEYDEQGRAFVTHVFGVDPSSGSVSTYSLDTNTWFNHRGQVVKTSAPGGIVSKMTYDGVGRVTYRYTTDGGSDSGWSDADDVTSDAVLEQIETAYDDSGNVTLATTRQRFHDETSTGALGTPSSGVHARVSFVAYYYDKANRLTDTVNVGTNGGSTYSRPSTPDSRSLTVLVNSTEYDDAGRPYRLTDPRGIESRTYFDLMGRTTETIENYQNGSVSDTDDKTTDYTYFGPRLTYTIKAWLTTTDSETTQYIYGVSSSDGSTIASNDLMRETRWPDKSTGAASATDHELWSYDGLGERTSYTDRNASVHAYSFDVVSRPISDAVTTLASGVDGSIRRLETAYDSAGRAYQFTSYDASSGGNVVNQVQREFNGLGQITKEYQAHSGAVNTMTSSKVQYTYSEMASGANHSRLTSLVYPDAFTVSYNYASGLDNTISRLTSMTNSSTTLESYSYLGLGTVVQRAHPESGVDLTYTGTSNGEAGDKYVGLDRFGRVIDQRWVNGSGTDKDRFKYGYDEDSNRLYRSNELSHSFDELYHANGASYGYDGLNQLSDFRRGTLSDSNSDMIPDTVTTASRTQNWDPDALGNFETVTTDGTGTSRTHNKQNQLTAVGANSLTFDNNGNTTTDETGRTITYDAWNRLVKINSTTRYANDALGRRIKEGSNDLYYSTNWQVLEEYGGANPTARYVWSPVYIDALVLRNYAVTKNGGLTERLYVAQDANWNVTALIDTSGSVVERYVYDPYGRFDVKDASWGTRSSSSCAWVYLHQGGRWDATAGLFNFRYRDYSPTLMRWVSVDPIGIESSDPNYYRYELGLPTSSSDPSGKDIYLLIDPDGGVLGSGHTGLIVGNDTDGWWYISNGSGDHGSNEVIGPVHSLGGLQNRPPLRRYKTYCKWNTTHRQDKNATMQALIDSREPWKVRSNCWDRCAAAIAAAGIPVTVVKDPLAITRPNDSLKSCPVKCDKSGKWPPPSPPAPKPK